MSHLVSYHEFKTVEIIFPPSFTSIHVTNLQQAIRKGAERSISVDLEHRLLQAQPQTKRSLVTLCVYVCVENRNINFNIARFKI
jgi:hypothetical protein